MATINAISVALFNAAAGGYSAEMTANGAAFANAVGPVLEKDISTDALFVEHLLGNLGVTSSNAVYAQAKAAVAGLVAAKGRLGATVDAVDFLKAQEGSTSAYASVAADFAAKVNKAALFTAANATERDITKLVSAITGVDTDAAAISAAAAAATAAAEAKAAAAAISAATAAAAAAATAAAEAKAAAEKVAADAAAAAKTAADAAAATAAAAAKAAAEKVAADAAAAAKTAADAAAATAAAEAKAAAEKVAADAAAAAKTAADAALAAVDNTTYASEQAALDAANAAAATAAAAAKAEADAAAAKAAADLKAAQDQITALQNPVGATLALTTSADTKIGVGSGDTVTGTTATLAAADIIVDGVAGDGDTLTLTLTGSLNATGTAAGASNLATIAGFENVNVSIANVAAKEVNASTMTGVSNLAVTRTDVTVGSSTVSGDQTVAVVSLNATKVAAVTVGSDTTDVTITQATKAGVVVNANNASGDVTITGAATVNASGMGTGDTLIVNPLNVTAEDAKAVTVTTTAETVKLDNAAAGTFTGALTVNGGTSVKNVVSTSSAGGITVTALGETGTVGTDGIVIAAVDASGASVTTSYVGTSSAKGVISIDGSGSVDAASVSANGTQTLATAATNQIEDLTLSGNGAAVTYELTGAATTYTVTGSQAVTISGNESSFDGKTLVDNSTGTITVKITTLNDSDLSEIDADNFLVTSNVASKTLTLADGALVTLGTDITTAFAVAGAEADASISIATADDTAASGATIDITTGTLTADTNVAALSINATVGKLTISTATTLAADGVLTVTGTKNVALGALTAESLDASASTGDISLSASAVGTIYTGTGDDTVALDDADSATTVFTVATSAGDDIVTIEDAKVGTSIVTEGGDDQITIGSGTSADATAAYVISSGDGDDTVTISSEIDSDAIIVMGSGTDTLVLADTNGNDFSGNTNFNVSGVEVISISALTSGEIQISAAQFASDNAFKLSGNSVITDILNIVNVGTAGTTIDASNVTFDSTQAATLLLEGKAQKADVIMGSAKNDLIQGTTGGDTVDGGLGTDMYLAANLKTATVEGTGTGTSTGVVINLGDTAVTNTSVLGNISSYTANSVTTVAAGQIAYVFAASASTNSSVTSAITNVENVTGTAGSDYIVGKSSGGSLIDGGAGADYIVLGAGDDTIRFTASTDINNVISGFGTGTDVLQFGVDGTNEDLFDGSAVVLANTNSSATVGATTALAAADYNEIAVSGAMADNKINVLTTSAGYASVAAALDAVDTGGTKAADNASFILGFWNSTNARFEVHYVSDQGTSAADYANGTSVLVTAVGGITATGIAAALSEANFGTYTVA